MKLMEEAQQKEESIWITIIKKYRRIRCRGIK